MQSTLSSIPRSGYTAATIREMWRHVREGVRQPQTIAEARAVARTVPARDYRAIAEAWLRRTKRDVQFVSDPLGVETVGGLDWIRKVRAGDCDELSTWLSAHLQALGMDTRFVTIAVRDPRFFDHVYVEVYLDGKWVPADPSVAGSYLGWAPRRVLRKQVWPRPDDGGLGLGQLEEADMSINNGSLKPASIVDGERALEMATNETWSNNLEFLAPGQGGYQGPGYDRTLGAVKIKGMTKAQLKRALEKAKAKAKAKKQKLSVTSLSKTTPAMLGLQSGRAALAVAQRRNQQIQKLKAQKAKLKRQVRQQVAKKVQQNQRLKNKVVSLRKKLHLGAGPIKPLPFPYPGPQQPQASFQTQGYAIPTAVAQGAGLNQPIMDVAEVSLPGLYQPTSVSVAPVGWGQAYDPSMYTVVDQQGLDLASDAFGDLFGADLALQVQDEVNAGVIRPEDIEPRTRSLADQLWAEIARPVNVQIDAVDDAYESVDQGFDSAFDSPFVEMPGESLLSEEEAWDFNLNPTEMDWGVDQSGPYWGDDWGLGQITIPPVLKNPWVLGALAVGAYLTMRRK